ncbi:hypothetical protein BATDEDRAFT_36124 [Batrachochytrium dendrobatidis JAM81]|uniref:Copper acquisition factor BIM1-like domain-containing protein n=2 Tax=Batrachochytrium dendrobatidis TaxID=109871 RepID=F4PCD0_BATDJ|nr:uncharacterized protein BATDEDRAFT_36124 [Batrachochytrium dendrobatidis JAM81]EGF77258.1 hypothetical protein BATDEDRAFT_36124 [Batrachochytrium dendrobatidis JAM81]KAJ8330588.1 hypothetical protein O5D80_001563 [Batrachochytrium dendrobatidis]KAK5665560.1 hypothetical protein QVD99_007906 [Batrachochytrium dendrobatidis]OAJ44647.1 hypothetical protein BDEG_27857 [Batrachochytrium dendrobatidis JEL423]|eukprot:XP_006682237.1 hypothetical protein BATDEDRAFT_36124 [Batrachochytrium dendrobatidis JAM81]
MQLVTAFIAALASSASAHFILTSPATRGFDELKESTAPCGGYNTVASRTNAALKSNLVLEIADANAVITVKFGPGENPTTFPYTLGSRNYTAVGNYTIPIDMTSANASGILQMGQIGTIQVILQGTDGMLYQCADITLAATNGGSSASTSAAAPAGTNAAKAANSAKKTALSVIGPMAIAIPLVLLF